MLYVRRAEDSCPTRSTPNPLAAALDTRARRRQPSTAGARRRSSPRLPITSRIARRSRACGPAPSTLQVKLLPDGALPLLAAQVARTPASTCCRGRTRRARRSRPGCARGACRRHSRLRPRSCSSRTRAVSIWKLVAGREEARCARSRGVLGGDARTEGRRSARADAGRARQSRRRRRRAAARGVGARRRRMAQARRRRRSSRSASAATSLDLRLTAPSVEALDAIKQAMSQSAV